MAKYPSKTGDEGYTGILGEGRVAKHDLRIEAIGAVDEANSVMGMARALVVHPQHRATLLTVQRDLYGLMSELAATKENAQEFRKINPARVEWMETTIEDLTQQVRLPDQFIVPGDTFPGAVMDLARTTVRRAERRVAELLHRGDLENPDLLRYLNRLSSLCYLIEISEDASSGKSSPSFAKADAEE